MGKNGPFMEFLRKELELSAEDTYTDEAIPTPVSRIDSIAMLIHKVTFKCQEMITAGIGEVELSLNDRSLDEITELSDPEVVGDCNWKYENLFTTSGRTTQDATKTFYFDPPVLYSKRNLWLAGNSDGFTGAAIFDCCVGYTLEKVSKEHYIDALVED